MNRLPISAFIFSLLFSFNLSAGGRGNSVRNLLFKTARSCCEMVDSKLAGDIKELEEFYFGESLGPLSDGNIVKLKKSGLNSSEILKALDQGRKGERQQPVLYETGSDRITRLLENPGILGHLRGNPDSPLHLRWFDALLEAVTNVRFSLKIGRDHFIGNTTLLIRVWEEYENGPEILKTFIERAFDDAINSSDFQRALDEDLFIQTVLKACKEDKGFDSEVTGIIMEIKKKYNNI